MIDKMKKFTVLVTDSEYDGFIEAIRDLGVVHVTQLQQGATSPELQAAIDMEQRYTSALSFLEVVGKSYDMLPDTPAYKAHSPEATLQRVEELRNRENALLHEVDELEGEAKVLAPWGDFDQALLDRLSASTGMEIHFYRCSSKSFKKEWRDDLFAIPVNEESKMTYFVTFSNGTPDIQAEHITLPAKSYGTVLKQKDDAYRQLSNVRQEMLAINAAGRDVLEAGLVEARDDMSLSRVHLSSERTCGDVLRLILGWVRADATDALVEYLDNAHIFYEMEDPAFEDDVPVHITNGRLSRLFEPILKMYSLPNYNDLDPTVFMAPFFTLFFGLCMGDAGYGMLILLLTAVVALKGSGDMRDYGRLGILLGASTVLCGLVTGTVFGIDLSQQEWSFVQPFKPYFLNENGVGQIFGYSPMMVLSVVIGMVQILLGMILKGCKAARNYGWPYAVGTFSWVVVLLVLIAMYGLPACGVALPEWGNLILSGVACVGGVGIFLYNSPAAYKRPALGLLSNIGGGLWETYGMATGLLGDLLSYIRLFALGLTGGVLAGVFNSLALDMSADMALPIRILFVFVVLLLGHGITFALSMISAFVHPIRLTFVEFFKNADFSGGGKEYSPFRYIK